MVYLIVMEKHLLFGSCRLGLIAMNRERKERETPYLETNSEIEAG